MVSYIFFKSPVIAEHADVVVSSFWIKFSFRSVKESL